MTGRAVLAEFFTMEDQTLLFIGRSDFRDPIVKEIARSRAEIRAAVQEHFGEERDAAGGVVRTTRDKVEQLRESRLEEFFGPFLAPLTEASETGEAYTEPGDIIWLVPHDALHYVPLHAVRVNGEYLGVRNPVCYTPSASIMRYCQEARVRREEAGLYGRPGRALILADSRADRPLLHARDQARTVQEMLGAGAQVFVDGAATKSLVKRWFVEGQPPVNILHLACHGYFSAEEPLRSGIALAPEDQAVAIDLPGHDPANMTAEEIFGLRLDTDLVTLSACETGVSERRPGDELIGLTRAVLYAGAPSVLVTLWSVDSVSTSLLMGAFYRAMIQGLGKATALREAQLALRNVTAADAIAHCAGARRRLGLVAGSVEDQTLDWDIADIRVAARDFRGALSIYECLLNAPNLENDWVQSLERASARCRLALRAAADPDLTVKPFDRPYYWAPFILVGDWT